MSCLNRSMNDKKDSRSAVTDRQTRTRAKYRTRNAFYSATLSAKRKVHFIMGKYTCNITYVSPFSYILFLYRWSDFLDIKQSTMESLNKIYSFSADPPEM